MIAVYLEGKLIGEVAPEALPVVVCYLEGTYGDVLEDSRTDSEAHYSLKEVTW